ncbi:MAG TPA: NfeD family protein [Saprospiraceae bacterium]|nr:NfeD family protein [Saprospiraceae bacterium]
MGLLIFIRSFDLLSLSEKLLWSVAIVATLLLLILMVMRFLGYDLDKEHPAESGVAWLDTNSILLFFTFLGWSSILAHLWEDSIVLALLYGLPIGLLAATAPFLIKAIRKQLPSKGKVPPHFNLEETLSSTGEVLNYIPPHIKGKGKVHLNLRNAPYKLNAVSQYGALSRGVPVRVVAIMDDQTLVVEPLDGRPPHLPG